MSDSVKITLIVTTGLLLLLGGAFASCNHSMSIDAAAPVVESCVKHPATVNPFRRAQ